MSHGWVDFMHADWEAIWHGERGRRDAGGLDLYLCGYPCMSHPCGCPCISVRGGCHMRSFRVCGKGRGVDVEGCRGDRFGGLGSGTTWHAASFHRFVSPSIPLPRFLPLPPASSRFLPLPPASSRFLPIPPASSRFLPLPLSALGTCASAGRDSLSRGDHDVARALLRFRSHINLRSLVIDVIVAGIGFRRAQSVSFSSRVP